tara:strand:+ start:89 stop:493 length:405 start_codon:yes stop_codon:yes gene_type:complete
MSNQEILVPEILDKEILDCNYDPKARSLKLIGDCAMWSIEEWRSIADIKRIVELESKLQTAQTDKLDAIAEERKRWDTEDLVALQIRDLGQQIKGANAYAENLKILPWLAVDGVDVITDIVLAQLSSCTLKEQE